MSFPLLDFLTGRAREALPYLRSAAAKGLSVAAAIDILKPLNLTFNRQRMVDVYGSLMNRISPDRIERLVGTAAPFPKELHHTLEMNIESNYQYVVNVINAETDEEEYLTVSSSVPLAAEVIREKGAQLFAEGQYFERASVPVTSESVNIIEANVSPTVP